MSSNGVRTVRPTSAGQQTALQSSRLPRPELVADNVWAIAAPIPEGGVTYTLSYVLLSGDSASFSILDPGWDSPGNLDALHRSLGLIGLTLEHLSTVVATHHHPDHLGIAATLRAMTGARVVLSREERAVLTHQLSPELRSPASYSRVLEAWGVPAARRGELTAAFARPPAFSDIEPDLLLDDGDMLDLGSHSLTALATPGHTGGHLCFADNERKLLYTGDHILPQIHSGFGLGSRPGDKPLPDYLASLQSLQRFGGYEVLPGHEFRFRGLDARAAEICSHHLRRTQRIADLLPELGDASVWDYSCRLHGAGWPRLHGFFLHAALRQTELHLELARSGLLEGLVARCPEPGTETNTGDFPSVSAGSAG
ncbi:MBL fold metallo-hydrolase [Arthrobacter sp. zg-Y820]|uniref:MBL fold metallo-hydrolase n=1 Tax=unclassified Arthrobacter TaxID=235627 RepID=UPI001E56B534|nr:MULTISPECIES: MBL fold metallo-hydrolase [unclassified Arthrobacter]MCC9196827.1 MBL fold metallo-hydrolase [Arthrobacter sp. zg-Y820]MDK1279690.1 MBL fold metallo-hydrolase [Arthrobacter sp. zg.Y820]WIB07941.1 MBL fold metallo-hydrolase [Arthrobacter sp. zg-Y820]